MEKKVVDEHMWSQFFANKINPALHLYYKYWIITE